MAIQGFDQQNDETEWNQYSFASLARYHMSYFSDQKFLFEILPEILQTSAGIAEILNWKLQFTGWCQVRFFTLFSFHSKT